MTKDIRISELIEQANSSQDIHEKLQLLEEAVCFADTHSDLESRFWARFELIEAASQDGYPEKAVVAFSWCLSQWDKDSEVISQIFQLLTLAMYKWIVPLLPGFLHISREQIYDTLEDLT